MKLNSIWTYLLVIILSVGGVYFYKIILPKMQAKRQMGNIEDFDAFYEKFLTDSTFQMSRINFPVEGLPAQADSSHFADGYQWTENNWDIHKQVDAEKLGYERDLVKTEYLVKEVLYHPEGWGLERRFMVNDNGKWYLVYYAAPNAVRRNNLRAG